MKIHNVLIRAAQDKYQINDMVPKMAKDKNPLLPSCSNAYLFQLTHTWDKGSKQTRERLLRQFVDSMKNATGPQLEKELNNGASLFLTRISAWLRLTYLLGYDLQLQLSAITIFVSAASGNRFLTEFLEVGGILTVLDILTISQANENDRAEALHLLLRVASNGRKYKEFICESYGVRQVTECLSKSKSETTQDYAKSMLISLGTGNPKFQMQVFKGLQSLLSSPAVNSSSQQMAAQALRTMLKTTEVVPSTLIDPCASLLRSQHIQVQYEGYELLKELIKRPNCQDAIIVLLIAVLRTEFDIQSQDDQKQDLTTQGWQNNNNEEQLERERVLSGYVQHAYSSKLVGSILASDPDLTLKLIQNQVVSALLNVVANVAHPESQRYAVSNITFLVTHYPIVNDTIREFMGDFFYDLLQKKPDTFYKELNKDQVRFLRRNNLRIHMDSNPRGRSSSFDHAEDDAISRRRTSSFPNAFDRETHDQAEEKEIPNVEHQQDTVAVEPDVKAKQKIILENYEKEGENQEIFQSRDLYQQYENNVGISATFPSKKFVDGNEEAHKDRFKNDLDKFKQTITETSVTKKPFIPEMESKLEDELRTIGNEEDLFSHENVTSKTTYKEKDMIESWTDKAEQAQLEHAAAQQAALNLEGEVEFFEVQNDDIDSIIRQKIDQTIEEEAFDIVGTLNSISSQDYRSMKTSVRAPNASYKGVRRASKMLGSKTNLPKPPQHRSPIFVPPETLTAKIAIDEDIVYTEPNTSQSDLIAATGPETADNKSRLHPSSDVNKSRVMPSTNLSLSARKAQKEMAASRKVVPAELTESKIRSRRDMAKSNVGGKDEKSAMNSSRRIAPANLTESKFNARGDMSKSNVRGKSEISASRRTLQSDIANSQANAPSGMTNSRVSRPLNQSTSKTDRMSVSTRTSVGRSSVTKVPNTMASGSSKVKGSQDLDKSDAKQTPRSQSNRTK